MLYQREGFPEEGELLLCKVTKIHFHSVFVNIEEYGKSGLIHISEIAPGRIRNIGDYVKEGKMVVCVVLKIDEEKGHIDLSLRRVSEGQRRAKVNEIKAEQKAEKIVEFTAKALNDDFKKVYNAVSSEVFKNYIYLNTFFDEVAFDETPITKYKFDKKLSDQLLKEIKERIKPQVVEIKGEIKLSSYDENGLEVVKKALMKGESVGKDSAAITYKGGGLYNLVVRSNDYKSAEVMVQKIIEAIKKEADKSKCEFAFNKLEK